MILSCTKLYDWVLDPFAGSGTTGIAASLLNRGFCGIEQIDSYCQLAKKRREEIEKLDIQFDYLEKIYKEIKVKRKDSFMVSEEDILDIRKLPF